MDKGGQDWITGCQGVHIFHPFTGCDAVSTFRGRGEKIPTNVVCGDHVLTDRVKQLGKANDTRLDTFASMQRSYDTIPPNVTETAIKEDVTGYSQLFGNTLSIWLGIEERWR